MLPNLGKGFEKGFVLVVLLDQRLPAFDDFGLIEHPIDILVFQQMEKRIPVSFGGVVPTHNRHGQ